MRGPGLAGLRKHWTIVLVTAGLSSLLAGNGGAQPPVLDAEVNAEGLHRVDPSLMREAWVRPDADLSSYTRIFFLPTAMQFREIPERQRYNARVIESMSEFPVDERIRARLTESFGESFHEAVSGVRAYELSNELGRDVLMVRGFLLDVITGVPPDLVGNNVASVRWAWEADIVMELRDAMTNELLARTIDRERIEGPFDADAMYGLVPLVTSRWARLLVTRIRELTSFYPSRLQRLQERAELERNR